MLPSTTPSTFKATSSPDPHCGDSAPMLRRNGRPLSQPRAACRLTRSDVVLLDWPQSETVRQEWEQGRAPLSDRDKWQKPTVLLGSAGLNLAVVWKVRGGSG